MKTGISFTVVSRCSVLKCSESRRMCVHACVHSYTRPFVHTTVFISFVHSFVRARPCVRACVYTLVLPFVRYFIHACVRTLVLLFVRTFARLLGASLVCLFVHPWVVHLIVRSLYFRQENKKSKYTSEKGPISRKNHKSRRVAIVII